MKFKSVNVISVQDWDALVVNTYGRMYSFQQQDDCKPRGTEYITVPDHADDYENDTVPEQVNHPDMGVSFKAWLARDPQQPLDSPEEWDRKSGLRLWWDRNFYPNVQMIANDLHAKGLLPAGEFMIDIDW
jgi:hypothetical protein